MFFGFRCFVPALLFALLPFYVFASSGEVSPSSDVNTKRWVMYLGDELPSSAFDSYDVIVFDAFSHPRFRSLQNRGKDIIGKVDFFDASKSPKSSNHVKKYDLLIKGKEKYGAYIDIRRKEFLNIVIQKYIPHLVKGGFNGVLIRGLDEAVGLELKYPDKYPGMIEAAVGMIRLIKKHYPYLILMLDRGAKIVPMVRNDIDVLLMESGVFYNSFSADDPYEKTLKWLAKLKELSPHLEFYSIDYEGPLSKEEIKLLYERRRKDGFIPYVTSPGALEHYEIIN